MGSVVAEARPACGLGCLSPLHGGQYSRDADTVVDGLGAVIKLTHGRRQAGPIRVRAEVAAIRQCCGVSGGQLS